MFVMFCLISILKFSFPSYSIHSQAGSSAPARRGRHGGGRRGRSRADGGPAVEGVLVPLLVAEVEA
jgi:hypothetical protein